MSWFCPKLQILGLLVTASASLLATDPPHQIATANAYGTLNYCSTCHKIMGGATGSTLTTVKGNSNLCLSCHVTGGSAAAKAIAVTDQAVPAGLVGATAAGTSHRWDSGPQGRLSKGTPNTSTGTIKPSGVYTGAYASTIQIKITTAGAVGTAKYDWSMTPAGSTTFGTATAAVATTTTATALGTTGVSLAFSSTGTFNLNDIFYLYVRSDLRAPVAAAMLNRTESGNMMCSSCHDQHLQAQAPFDPLSPATYTAGAPYTSGVTIGRHFQRADNSAGGMCGDCHANRNVGKGGTSHPVHVNRAAAPNTKAPSASLILSAAGNVECLTCHDVHGAPTTTTPAGMLLRVSNSTALCADCHTLADTTTANTHTNPTTGILWPSDQYGGSTYPAFTLAADRGACKNCHTPHGWPDAGNPGQKYGLALGARQDNLCTTCHDSNGPSTKDVRTQITKAVRHPVARTSGSRLVGCADCHNPHMAVAGVHTYGATTPNMDANRNRIRDAAGTTIYSGAMKGVDGVTFAYAGLAAWAVPTTTNLTKINTGSPTVAASGAEFEYQVCFKCHTSYDAFGTTRPGGITSYYSTGTAKFTSGSTAVVGTTTVWTAAMVGMYIQKDINSPAYRITAATATSLTLATAYVGTTDAAGAAYSITREQTNLAQEFNPANASFHPVVAGLAAGTGNGTNKKLATSQMKAPWNVNVGTQTMLCSDCHNTDAASPAAQGPHGSAVQFMLRGANPTAWPNVTLGSSGVGVTNSWCGNCHAVGSAPHTTGDHSSAPCYYCHIVVPHGGKVGRLIATNGTGLPSRYAYNNDRTNVALSSFTKSTTGTYSQAGNCGTSGKCTYHSLSGGATW